MIPVLSNTINRLAYTTTSYGVSLNYTVVQDLAADMCARFRFNLPSMIMKTPICEHVRSFLVSVEIATQDDVLVTN